MPPVIAKIIAKITLESIREHLESILDNQQVGFRSGSSYVDHINTLQIIIEQCVEYRYPLHLLFIDLEKAFNDVNREFIWSTLYRNGIPYNLAAIIRTSYEGSVCHVTNRNRLSKWCLTRLHTITTTLSGDD